jgi:hypothetical protein
VLNRPDSPRTAIHVHEVITRGGTTIPFQSAQLAIISTPLNSTYPVYHEDTTTMSPLRSTRVPEITAPVKDVFHSVKVTLLVSWAIPHQVS